MGDRTVLTTGRVRLRHVRPDDYDRLYAIESDPSTLSTWRYRGVLPPPDQYEAALWRQTMFLMVIETVPDARVVGYVHLYDVDLRAGHGWMSLYAEAAHRRRGTVIEGLLLFGDWVFANTPIRWMYSHAFEMNLPQFASGERHGVSRHVGTLRRRVEVDGIPTDVHVLAMGKDNWLSSTTRARLHRLQRRRGERR